MSLDIFIRNIISSQRPRIYYDKIEDSRIVAGRKSRRQFEKNKSYFIIRLSDFYLRNCREFLRHYIPSVLIVCEFSHAGTRHAVPFFLDVRKLITGGGVFSQFDTLEVRNTKIAGPLPYVGGDVGLFVGLFRAVSVDHLTCLFNIVGDLFKAFDLPGFTRNLEVGKILGEGLSNILSIKDVEPIFAIKDHFSSEGNDRNRFRSGFLTYVNEPERNLESAIFWVREGRLFVGNEMEAIEPYDKHDFCLVQIEHLEHRSDFELLPFHRLWTEAKGLILSGEIEKARAFTLPELIKDIKTCSELIEDDQTSAMFLYKAKFEREVEDYLLINGPREQGGLRGGRSVIEEPGARAMLQKAAVVAEGFLEDEVTGAALSKLAENLDYVLGHTEGQGRRDLANETIAKQLERLRQARIPITSPGRVADAIYRDVIHTFESGRRQ